MNSKYFKDLDYFNLKSKDGLIILPKFKTFFQTTDYTCGPACVLMALRYFGYENLDEMTLAKQMKSNPFPNGTLLINMVNCLKDDYKADVISNYDFKRNENGLIFETFSKFKKFLIENLRQGNIVILENVDYGGHYKVLIGYDEINENCEEDMLIFADPSDFNDGNNDGYSIFPADRFFYMWFDDHCLELESKKQPFVIIKNKNNSN